MLPVAIFRHSPTEGPGYFAIFLEQQGIPWRLVAIDEGEPVPAAVDAYSGLCFMGGPMSVNDPLPWIEPVCNLIREAVARHIPVIGHCLGGQLMSKALGGKVTRNPVKEIGWQTSATRPGAPRLFSNMHCANQMFALGPHLGMQCHVEMTPEMIATWCGQWADEAIAVADQPSVQTPEAMQQEIVGRLPLMRQLSEQLYSVWIKGLQR